MDSKDQDILEEIQAMSGYEFEQLVADLWESYGWNTTVTSESNDRGVDVHAEKEHPVPQKQVIQAKCYSSGNKIGSPDIQQYASLEKLTDNVDAVVVVTTTEFSSQAQDLANTLDIKTVDGPLLISSINDTDIISKRGLNITQTDSRNQSASKPKSGKKHNSGQNRKSTSKSKSGKKHNSSQDKTNRSTETWRRPSGSSKDLSNVIKQTIRKYNNSEKYNKGAPAKDVVATVTSKGYSKSKARSRIKNLCRNGELRVVHDDHLKTK